MECDIYLTEPVLKITASQFKKWDDEGVKGGGVMVALDIVDAQLAKVGMRNRYFGRPEVRELCHIMAPGEVIQHAVNGQYEGGFAMLVATDRRILLIDKKPWFLTMEDVRYDMVSEVDFYARLLDSSVTLVTVGKKLTFRGWRQERLRDMVRYIQQRVMDLHQHERNWQIENQIAESSQPVSVPQQDFSQSYQTHIKRHSLAHVAGKVAIDTQRRHPIIRPLYPRPSLVTRTRQGAFYSNSPTASVQEN